MRHRAISALLLLACLCISHTVIAQEIKATSIGKMPPAHTSGGGIQIDIYNQTSSRQRLEVREPGGNWYQFTIPAQSGVNLRCQTEADHFEASLSGNADGAQPLTPGVIYDVLMSSRTGQPTITQRRS
jgi:hypothetical protein